MCSIAASRYKFFLAFVQYFTIITHPIHALLILRVTSLLQPWRIWVVTPYESFKNYNVAKKSTWRPCVHHRMNSLSVSLYKHFLWWSTLTQIWSLPQQSEVIIVNAALDATAIYFADDIFKHTFFNENVWISIKISLKFVPKGPINNIPALAQIMAWRCSGDKPLSEPMMVSLPTHICITRPQWVNKHFQMQLMSGWQ